MPLLSEEPIKSLERQYTGALWPTDGESHDETALRRSGKHRIKPTPKEVQGLVLPVYALQEGDVATENEWETLIHCK